MLDLVISEARRQGVETVDLRPSYRENRIPYLFLPDDSHWNARGIDLAAPAISKTLQRRRPAPRPGRPAGVRYRQRSRRYQKASAKRSMPAGS